MNSYEQPILDFVSDVVAEAGGGAVVRDTPLLEAGVLDSINLVRLIQFMEERFGISIPDSDFGPELFESPASLAAYVERRKQS
jgi:acyl carrier protein